MKKVFLLFASAAVLFSCSDDDVENYQTDAHVLGFKKTSTTINHFTDEGVVHYDIPFDLITGYTGTGSSRDIQVSYEIDPSSTAVEGTEFNFSSGMATVLEAGSKFGLIGLDVNSGSLDPNVATKLVLNLTTTDPSAVVSAQNKQVTINFVGCISIIQTGAYTVQINNVSTVYGGQTMTQNISYVDVNTFSTSETLPYVPGSSYVAGLPNYGFIFEDICGEITIPSQNLFNYYSNEVVGVPYDGLDLANQQGKVLDPDTFVLSHKVAGSNTYYSYLTFIKQ